MRYGPGQKAKAKQTILEAGAKTLRKSGFHGIGVDGLAAAAGVTSGAFYSNFSSKEELLKDVIAAYVGNPFFDADAGSPAERRARLKDYLRMYISCQHRDDPAAGCVMPTLSADVSRSSASVRQAYRSSMQELIRKMARSVAGHAGEPGKEGVDHIGDDGRSGSSRAGAAFRQGGRQDPRGGVGTRDFNC